MTHRRHRRQDPQQRRPRRRPPPAAGARVVAAEVHRVVEGARPGRLPGQRRVPAHGDLRRPGGLGQLRPRQDARLPLGHLPRRPRGRPPHRLRRPPRRRRCGRRCPASTAPTCAGCSSCRATPSRRRSSSSARCASPRRASTTCATCSRSTSRRAATCGRWCTCCTATSAATAATRPTRCSSATPATPTTRASSAPSTSRRRTGCRSSSSPTSPTATASSSSPRCARARSTRCRGRATSCSRRRPTTCSWAPSGIGRVVQRTVELMKEHDTADVEPFGGIDVATLQRYLNFHYSVSLDLFGAETSTNAANYFAAGLKGRFQEERRDDDHRLQRRDARRADASPTARSRRARRRRWPRSTRRCATTTSPTARRASTAGTARSPRSASSCALPHIGFNRAVGAFRDHHVSPDGRLVDDAEWAASVADWLPTDDDRAHVESLMRRRHRAGEDGRLGRRAVDRASTRSRSTTTTCGSDSRRLGDR